MLIRSAAGFAAGVELSLDGVSPVASLWDSRLCVHGRGWLVRGRSQGVAVELDGLMVCEKNVDRRVGWADGGGKVVDGMDGLRQARSLSLKD